MILLDGRALASKRLPLLRQRADDVTRTRGRAPSLLLIAFGRAGNAPHVAGKLRACSAAGVEALPVVVDVEADAGTAVRTMRDAVQRARADAVFLQVPAPAHMPEDQLIAEIPPAADVDVMTDERASLYMREAGAPPPVTIMGALLLLDEFAIHVAGRRGIIAAEESPFARMFAVSLARRGASVTVVPPTSGRVGEAAARADVVVAAAAQPRLIDAAMLRPGCIALDIGYYNPGAVGDIDISAGTGHLAALMPVPGGVGPMTVSALVERTIALAEA